jgi:KaiC/GvpD/RAD55 family RecA-like ATPase
METCTKELIAKDENAVTVIDGPAENKGFYSAKELFDMNIKELPMLVNPLFLKSGISVFAGSSDTGKSTFLRQLGIAIAKGDEKFLGFDLDATHNRAIYVSTEDDRYAISYLLNKTLGEEPDTDYLLNFRYIFDTTRLVNNLDAILSEKPADCVIIDTLTDLYAGDLNQSNKVREFLNPYFILADKHNCLFVFIHHTGKRTEEYPPNKNNLLGSQGIEGKARQVIELRRDPLQIQYRHLCVVKGNYIPDDMKTHSFKLQFNTNLTFTMTDERVAFEELIISQMDKVQNKKLMQNRVVELRNSGKSYTEIAEIMTEEGMPISKSTANNYYRADFSGDMGDSLFE